jgi:hypothetical protein
MRGMGFDMIMSGIAAITGILTLFVWARKHSGFLLVFAITRYRRAFISADFAAPDTNASAYGRCLCPCLIMAWPCSNGSSLQVAKAVYSRAQRSYRQLRLFTEHNSC